MPERTWPRNNRLRRNEKEAILLLGRLLLDLIPVIDLATHTSRQTWFLAGLSGLLGLGLGGWVRIRQANTPSGRGVQRTPLAPPVIALLTIGAASSIPLAHAPAGVQMIYSACVAGLLAALLTVTLQCGLTKRWRRTK